MVKYNQEIAREVLPYFIYKRLKLTHYREYFTFKIDYGFGYWLRSIRVKYSELANNRPSTFYITPGGEESAPKLLLEIFDNANFKARQPLPVFAELISTPGSDKCYSFAAPLPVDNDGFSINFSASPAVKSLSNLNFLYKYGDIIRIDITGQTPPNEGSDMKPLYLDLLLTGYYVPQKSFEMYGGVE